jgi:hypothetical protein
MGEVARYQYVMSVFLIITSRLLPSSLKPQEVDDFYPDCLGQRSLEGGRMAVLVCCNTQSWSQMEPMKVS